MADHNGYNWLLGPGQALDTTRYFVVATEMFGNGHSSSPSNTPEPFHGPRIPGGIDSRQRAHRPSSVDRLAAPHAPPRDRRLLDGRRAGIPVGGVVSRFRRPHRRHLRYREMLSTRCGATRGPDRRARGPDAAFQAGDYTAEPMRGIRAFEHRLGRAGSSLRNGGVPRAVESGHIERRPHGRRGPLAASSTISRTTMRTT